MEEQDRGFPGLPGGGRPDRNGGEAHRPDQTGLTKQDYIIRRLLCRDVVVQGNPRVYKALRDQLAAVLDELRRIEAGQSVNDELLDTIQMIATIMNGMQEDFAYDR